MSFTAFVLIYIRLSKVFTHPSKMLNSGVPIISVAAGVKIKNLCMQYASTNTGERMGCS